jgi:hypothetical protein
MGRKGRLANAKDTDAVACTLLIDCFAVWRLCYLSLQCFLLPFPSCQMAEVRRNGCQLYQEQLMGLRPDGSKKYPNVVDETSPCPRCVVPGQPDVFVDQHPHQPPAAAAMGQRKDGK